jgi:transcriptional regulator with XRE-family HTH domain
MRADEFRERLEELGLSQSAFARKAGIHVRSAQKYARGERPIPAVVVALLDCWRTIARLRQELDP